MRDTPCRSKLGPGRRMSNLPIYKRFRLILRLSPDLRSIRALSPHQGRRDQQFEPGDTDWSRRISIAWSAPDRSLAVGWRRIDVGGLAYRFVDHGMYFEWTNEKPPFS